jgi:hypothetical protein
MKVARNIFEKINIEAPSNRPYLRYNKKLTTTGRTFWAVVKIINNWLTKEEYLIFKKKKKKKMVYMYGR